MTEKAQKCVETHAKQAVVVSFIPLVSIPIIYGVCAKMIIKLDKIFGIKTAKGFNSEIVYNIAAGIIAAPALAIPFLGAGIASVYIKSIGETYVEAVSAVVGSSTLQEISNNALTARRLKEELQKIYAKKRKDQLERQKNIEKKEKLISENTC